MGVGLVVERHGTSTKIKTLSSPLDILSKNSFFDDDARNAVWGQVPLPRIISPKILVFSLLATVTVESCTFVGGVTIN